MYSLILSKKPAIAKPLLDVENTTFYELASLTF